MWFKFRHSCLIWLWERDSLCLQQALTVFFSEKVEIYNFWKQDRNLNAWRQSVRYLVNVKTVLVFSQDYSSKWNSHVCTQKQHSIQRERSCLWAEELEQESLKHWELFGTTTGGLLTKRLVEGLSLPPSLCPLRDIKAHQHFFQLTGRNWNKESTTGNLDDKRCLIPHPSV